MSGDIPVHVLDKEEKVLNSTKVPRVKTVVPQRAGEMANNAKVAHMGDSIEVQRVARSVHSL